MFLGVFWGFFFFSFFFVGQVNSNYVDLFQVIGGQLSCGFFFFFLLPVTVSLGGFAASFMFHHLSVTFKSESSFCKVMGDEYRL